MTPMQRASTETSSKTGQQGCHQRSALRWVCGLHPEPVVLQRGPGEEVRMKEIAGHDLGVRLAQVPVVVVGGSRVCAREVER